MTLVSKNWKWPDTTKETRCREAAPELLEALKREHLQDGGACRRVLGPWTKGPCPECALIARIEGT